MIRRGRRVGMGWGVPRRVRLGEEWELGLATLAAEAERGESARLVDKGTVRVALGKSLEFDVVFHLREADDVDGVVGQHGRAPLM